MRITIQGHDRDTDEHMNNQRWRQAILDLSHDSHD